MNLVVGESLRLQAQKNPDKIAVVFQDKKLSYGELNCRANRLANGLLKSGLRKGDKVAVLLYNCREWPEIYYGLAKAGLIMVPISFRLEKKEIEYLIKDSGTTFLITGQEFKGRISCDMPCLYLGEAYEEFLAKNSDEEPQVMVSKEDIFFIGYTSGTTGRPKGAVRTHKADVTNIIISAMELGFTEETVSLLVMPLFHCNSIWFALATLRRGGKVVVYPSLGFNPKEFLETIKKEKITFTSLVPTHYVMIINISKEVKKKYRTGSIKTLLCSSAPLMTKTKEAIIKFFDKAQLYEAYGATETGMVTLLGPKDQLRKIRCIGRPVWRTKVKILGENYSELGPGEIGELYVKNGALLKAYHNNPQAFKKSFFGNFFSVGDMGKIDEEGYFYLVDRKDDVINSGGEKVFPVEVEEIISKHEAVKEVAVIGAPDEKWGESVKAVVVLKAGMAATAEEIINFCQGKLGGFKKPKSVDFVQELPKTPTGKILRRLVREKYWQGV